MTTLDPAHVDTPDLSSTYAVAEFMLNLLSIEQAPTRKDVETYIQAHFAIPGGSYRIPVHQDFLQIRAKGHACGNDKSPAEASPVG